MANQIFDISPTRAARTAGFGLLFMTVLAIFAEFYVRQTMIVPGDAAATFNNITDNELLFRVAICCYLVVAILDIVVAWGLYILLKPTNKSLSLLSAWFRIIYAAILGVALTHLLSAAQLIAGVGQFTAIGEIQTLVMLQLNGFGDVWNVGLVIFGLHLSVLGYLIYQSDYFPKFLGILVTIASFGYVIDSFGVILSPAYNLGISQLTFVGEVLLMFWLLFKRFDVAPE